MFGGTLSRSGRAVNGRANSVGVRLQRVIAIVGVNSLMAGAVIIGSTAPVSAFDGTTYASPITAAADFATGFPTTASRAGELGPLGMIHDGKNFFVSDPVDGHLYRFPLTVGMRATHWSRPVPVRPSPV